jgi:hypothetical protein
VAKNFTVEQREVSGNQYVKVFLKDIKIIVDVQTILNALASVKKVNISDSKSADSLPQNLTVYPSKVYDITETISEVQLTLENYFIGSPLDPNFVDETISEISDNAYFQILDYILLLGKNIENYTELKHNFNEERSRDYFLPFLNTVSNNHTATGETFNKIGKTDILIQDNEGNNVFIAECKIWHGQAQIQEAINQLLERYISWRDEKSALIIFNKDVRNFTDVISNAKVAVESHPNYLSFIAERSETSFSYILKHPEDDKKTIKFELILFNFI